MPFLFPAVASGFCDGLILWLHHNDKLNDEDNYRNGSSSVEQDGNSIYRVLYLVLLAVIRLFLLVVPLTYHAYTGTAIRCPLLYRVFYGVTVASVLLHMLALSMIDPDSLATLVLTSSTSSTITSEEEGDAIIAISTNYYMVLVRRHCWWILILSLVATVAHTVMLVHVRSTAPAPVMPAWFSSKINESYSTYGGRGRASRGRHGRSSTKTVLLYYASKQQSSWRGTAATNTDAVTHNNDNGNSNSHSHPSPTNNNGCWSTSDDERPTTPTQQQTDFATNIVSPIQKLSSQYDEFVGEMQSRIQVMKLEWTKRLDDFTHRHLHYLHQNTSSETKGAVISSKNNQAPGNGMARRLATTGNPIPNPLLPLTPFRVLLHLFAYEEVLNNGKLDAVFDIDQGVAMTFFVPQLLSFLLHGAYDDLSTRLETWILNKCEANVHFAHRCFWFLRSWCLEVSLPAAPATPLHGTAPSSSFIPQKCGGLRSNASSNLSLDTAPSSQPQTRDRFMLAREWEGDLFGLPGRHNSRNNSVTSLTSLDSNNNNSASGKFLPEEREVILGLLLRVIKCGEIPAQTLQFGPKQRSVRIKKGPQLAPVRQDQDLEAGASVVDDEREHLPPPQVGGWPDYDNRPSDEASLTPETIASLPVDPATGFPSTRHLETVAAKRRFGYMPLDSREQQLNTDKRQEQELCPQDALSTRYESEWFQSTPRFVDALISMADGLFLVPRDQRKAELKRQLRTLEVDLLPSNSIYVPIGNVHHRVWRVVPDESIALNTKERVPCIVCLEVVDYNSTMIPQATSMSKAFRSKINFSLDFPKLPQLGRLRNDASPPSKPPRPTSHEDAPYNNGSNLHYGGSDATCDSEEEEGEEINDGPVQPEPATATIPLNFLLPSAVTEYDIVNDWRFAKRDPHRSDSILEKMTNSMPPDMRERITKLREKGIHDMLSLTIPEGIVVDTVSTPQNPEHVTDEEYRRDCEIAAFICNDVFAGSAVENNAAHERSTKANLPDNAKDDRDDSSEPRIGKASSSAISMGQWYSPTGRHKSVVERRKGRLRSEDAPIRADHRVGYTSDEEPAYGSLQEHRKDKDSRPPRPTDSMNDKSKSRPPPVVFRENWRAKEDRLRSKSAFGSHPGWRLLPILIKANDDLRQEQLASQLIYRMAFILAREKIPVWLCPYEIVAVTDRGGIVEAIPDTISLDSLKRNAPNYTTLRGFLHSYFGEGTDALADAHSNFVESLAAYSIVTFLLQIKDRHNGNILIDNRGHLIHIDFGFFFLSSPGQNTGFESAPFKLTSDFVEVMGGTNTRYFRTFRELCVRSFIALRRHCMEIILLVEMLKTGNEDLNCFRGRPDDAIRGLRERFRLDLSDRACKDYVHSLIDESLENWRTNWYDRYQRYCVGVL